MKESTKTAPKLKQSDILKLHKKALIATEAKTRKQRINKDAELANLDRMISMHLKKEAAQ
jgi:hypothetical protein